MVEWLKEVLEVFKSPVDTFHVAVKVMDMYFATSSGLILDDLHEVGVTCMFIASKFTELEPLTIEIMVKKAAHGKVNRQQLESRERAILNSIQF